MSESGDAQSRMSKIGALETIGSFLKELRAKGPFVKLTASDLLPNELEESAIPDGHVMSARLRIESRLGNNYILSYNYIVHSGEGGLTHQLSGTTVSVRSDDNRDEIDVDDYKTVYEQIRRMNDGFIFRPEVIARAITKGGAMFDAQGDRVIDPSQAIGLSFPPTQKQLAEAMRKYKEEFRGVSGMDVFYQNVDNKRVKHTGLPTEKVRIYSEVESASKPSGRT